MYFGVQNLCLNIILTLAAEFSMPLEGLILEDAEKHLWDGLLRYLSVSGFGLIAHILQNKCLLGLPVFTV